MPLRAIATTCTLLFFVSFAEPLLAASTQSFSDLPDSHPAYAAVEFLKSKNIVQGYSDGTFRPDQLVTRAEAIKILIAPLVAQSYLDAAPPSGFSDIPSDSWYEPYVAAAALGLHVIDAPPKAIAFHGERTVILPEFLKILLLSQEANLKSFEAFSRPLARDVIDTTQWYYPWLRAGIGFSIIKAEPDGTLLPSRELTRSDVAMLMYDFFLYRAGERVQFLLAEVEEELKNLLFFIDSADLDGAFLASSRATLAAKGAAHIRGDVPIVQGAVFMTSAYDSMFFAYDSLARKNYDSAITYAGEAWRTGESLKNSHPELTPSATTVQVKCQEIANLARQAKAGG